MWSAAIITERQLKFDTKELDKKYMLAQNQPEKSTMPAEQLTLGQ